MRPILISGATGTLGKAFATICRQRNIACRVLDRGAMDIAAGAKTLIICMEHTTKEGLPKIVKECSYPLTSLGCVDCIVTDLAVIDVHDTGLTLREVAPGWSATEVQALTGATLSVPTQVPEIRLS